jgi:hypothetical protein
VSSHLVCRTRKKAQPPINDEERGSGDWIEDENDFAAEERRSALIRGKFPAC